VTFPSSQRPQQAASRAGDLKHNRAFTLIELLVVVAAIGILSALLLAVLLAARRRVRLAECGHNVRQLALAVQMFVSDHHVYPLEVNPDYFKGKYQDHDSGWPTHS
jgi:prepilin-type N-terminal cleavage/methylation domain-containing protein